MNTRTPEIKFPISKSNFLSVAKLASLTLASVSSPTRRSRSADLEIKFPISNMTLRALGNGVQYGYDDTTGAMHIVQTGPGGVTDLGAIAAPGALRSIRGPVEAVEPAVNPPPPPPARRH